MKLPARPRQSRPPKPRTRAKRIAAAAGGFAIVLGLLFGYGYCFGGPVSRYLSGRIAARYVDGAYPGLDYTLRATDQSYGYRYIFEVQSTASPDTRFHIWVNMGRIAWDTYEVDVGSFANTRERLGQQLRQDVAAALAAAGMETPADTSYWMVVGGSGDTAVPAEGHPPFALDMPYDKGNLPPVALALDLEIPEGTDDPQAAAWEFVQQVKSAMDTAGIDIAAYQVTFRGADASELYASSLIAAGDVPAAP